MSLDEKVRRVFRSSIEFVRWFATVQPRLICHGGRFDIQQLRYHYPELVRMGLLEPETCYFSDTSIVAKVHVNQIPPDWLDVYEAKRRQLLKDGEGQHRKVRGGSLKTLAPYHLGVEPFWESKSHDNDEYVLKDAEYTVRLYNHLVKQCSNEELSFCQKHLMPWSWMLIRAEERGVLIDTELLNKKRNELRADEVKWRARLDELCAGAHAEYERLNVQKVHEKYSAMRNQKVAAKNLPIALEKVARRLDYDSPAQMKWMLRDFFNLNVTTFEGDESTAKSVLNRLADQGNEVCAAFLKWRKAQKLLSTFLPAFEEFSQFDGAIHPSIFLDVTRTGRGSSSDPNCQNIPKDLRPIWRARPGYKFVTYDLASIEAVLIAFHSEDPSLVGLIQSGQSIHNVNTRIFFDLSCQLEDVPTKYDTQRDIAKNCGFATFYGAGANRIQETMANGGYQITKDRAKQILIKQKREFKDVFKYHWDVTQAFQSGESMTNLIGRPIYIQNWENAYMQGFNRLIQSGASDVNFHAARTALDKAKSVGIEAHLLLVVHDSNTFEVPEGQAEAFEKILLSVYDSLLLTTECGRVKIGAEGGISDVWD